MLTMETIWICYGIYLLINYVIDVLCIFIKALSNRSFHMFGFFLNMVAIYIWREVNPENTTIFFVGAGLLLINLIFQAALFIRALCSCDSGRV